MTIYALIPARAGSQRVPGKNTRLLGGQPLLAYSIAVAREAGIFADIWVSTDAMSTVCLAQRYGAQGFLNAAECHSHTAPDAAWITRLLRFLEPCEAFAILRPTSPFRRGETIRRAWDQFQHAGADSLRAVRPAREHPGKMWVERGGRLLPLLPFINNEQQPWHSMPTQGLPRVLVQTSALEMAWTARTIDRGTIAGELVMPFEMDAHEGFSIDTEEDWREAESRVLSPSGEPWPSRQAVDVRAQRGGRARSGGLVSVGAQSTH